MKALLTSLSLSLLCLIISACQEQTTTEKTNNSHSAQAAETFPLSKTESEWKRILPPASFHVMREHGTERPFQNQYDKNKADGLYFCRACQQPLYDSKHKFDSGTGWPSFYQPISGKQIGTRADQSLFGSVRTEVHCSRCGGHLGHVFDDGPQPTGLRYCMNSASLEFHERNEKAPALLK